MRLLVGLGAHFHLVELHELAVILGLLVGPDRLYCLDPLARQLVPVGERDAVVLDLVLVPPEADDPLVLGMSRREEPEALLDVGQGACPDQLHRERGHPQIDHVPVRVDQAREQRPSTAVDALSANSGVVERAGRSNDLAVVIEQETGKMLQLAVGGDLKPVYVVDPGVGASGRGEESGNRHRDQTLMHDRPHSIVECARKV